MSESAKNESHNWRKWSTSSELWEKLQPLAQQHRCEPTKAENRLWKELRGRKLNGLKFGRQHTSERFIVDFFCAQAHLVIEVDGSIHEYTVEDDATRTKFLADLGLRVLRFSNDAVLSSIDSVLEHIIEATNKLPPSGFPLSEFREGD